MPQVTFETEAVMLILRSQGTTVEVPMFKAAVYLVVTMVRTFRDFGWVFSIQAHCREGSKAGIDLVI